MTIVINCQPTRVAVLNDVQLNLLIPRKPLPSAWRGLMPSRTYDSALQGLWQMRSSNFESEQPHPRRRKDNLQRWIGLHQLVEDFRPLKQTETVHTQNDPLADSIDFVGV